jgi:hypothetical protein
LVAQYQDLVHLLQQHIGLQQSKLGESMSQDKELVDFIEQTFLHLQQLLDELEANDEEYV